MTAATKLHPEEFAQLRAQFACAAIAALKPPFFMVGAEETKQELQRWAKHAWAMADAMMEIER